MTAKEHNKIIGVLFLVQAGLGLLGLFIGILTFGFAGLAALTSSRSGDEAAAGIVLFGFLIVFLVLISVFLIPALGAGFGMLKQRRSARIWGIVAACLSLLSFPLGTALGVYALWFLLGDQGKAFYSSGVGARNAFNAPPPNSWR